MRIFSHVQFALILALSPLLNLSSQVLPDDVRSWQLVKTFIQETGSPLENIDRKSFQTRLTGEAAKIDIEKLKGRWPRFIDVYIDTIISLHERYRKVPGNKEENIPDCIDTILNSALAITTYSNGIYESYSFFCEYDSIWRIESWRQFPSMEERQAISDSILDLDTTAGDYLRQRSILTTLLLEEKSQVEVFMWIRTDATKIAQQLLRSSNWKEFDLTELELDLIGEYDALDDDLTPTELLLHRLNPSALSRLSTQGISKIIRYHHTGKKFYPLFELGNFQDKSVGFLYAPDSIPTPPLSKDMFFTMRPVDSNWWLYKGVLEPSSVSDKNSPVPQQSTQEKTEKGDGSLKRRSLTKRKNDKSQFLIPKE